MAISFTNCRCCECWTLTRLDDGTCGQQTVTIKMYGHFDRNVGDILKIDNHCWKITYGPSGGCEGAVEQAGVLAECPADCPVAEIDECKLLDPCDGAMKGQLIVKKDDLAGRDNVVKLRDPTGREECYEQKIDVPCLNVQEIDIVDEYANCLDCTPLRQCCTCADCSFEQTPLATLPSVLSFNFHYFNGVSGDNPVLRTIGSLVKAGTELGQVEGDPRDRMIYGGDQGAIKGGDTCAVWEGKCNVWNGTDPVCPGTVDTETPPPSQAVTGDLFSAHNADIIVWYGSSNKAKPCSDVPSGDRRWRFAVEGYGGFGIDAKANHHECFFGFEDHDASDWFDLHNTENVCGDLVGSGAIDCCGGDCTVNRNCPPTSANPRGDCSFHFSSGISGQDILTVLHDECCPVAPP